MQNSKIYVQPDNVWRIVFHMLPNEINNLPHSSSTCTDSKLNFESIQDNFPELDNINENGEKTIKRYSKYLHRKRKSRHVNHQKHNEGKKKISLSLVSNALQNMYIGFKKSNLQ